VIIGVPLALSFALSVALLLNGGIRGLRIYRAIYYVPSLFGGSVAIALLWRQIIGGEGLVNRILQSIGIEGMKHRARHCIRFVDLAIRIFDGYLFGRFKADSD
jgi:ABC-type sugar transport system permease subunit